MANETVVEIAIEHMEGVNEDAVFLGRFNFEKLRDEGYQQTHCGAVGCLGGWMQTNKEYRAFYKKLGFRQSLNNHHLHNQWTGQITDHVQMLGYWLELTVDDDPSGVLFDSQRNPGISEKQEALDRLRALLPTGDKSVLRV